MGQKKENLDFIFWKSYQYLPPNQFGKLRVNSHIIISASGFIHKYLKRQIRSSQAELISLDVYGSIFFE